MDGTFPALTEEPDGPFSRSAREIAVRLTGTGIDTVQTFEYSELKAGRAVAQVARAAWEVAVQRTRGIRPDSIPHFEASRSMTRASGSIMITVSGEGFEQVILQRPTGLVITVTRYSEEAELESNMLELLWADLDTPEFDAAIG